MGKLNQVVAVVNGQKDRAKRAFTDLHRKCGNPDLFDGMTRKYEPLDEEGETLPPESKKVQETVRGVMREANATLSQLFEMVETQDRSNCVAKADIEVNGEKVAADVPVTTLMWLEKQLKDLHTFVSKLPTLDEAENWHEQDEGIYKSDEKRTIRSKKVPRAHVMYEATEHHPAQVQPYTEDKHVGAFIGYKLSGRMNAKDKSIVVERVQHCIDGVRQAREEANGINEIKGDETVMLLRYVFGDMLA